MKLHGRHGCHPPSKQVYWLQLDSDLAQRLWQRMNIQVTRRQALQTGAGILTAGVVNGQGAAEDGAPLIIDCHAHIYGEDEKKYPTIADPYRPPKGKGTVAHLQREMQANGVRYEEGHLRRNGIRFVVQAVSGVSQCVVFSLLLSISRRAPRK